MEVASKVSGQAVAQASSQSTKRQSAPEVGQNLPTVEEVRVKAAPKVPEFEANDLTKALEELRSYVEGLGRNLSFRQDDSIDRSIITVRDESTQQVVRQIPNEEVVAIARQIRENLQEVRAGMLLDDKA
jgi:flagellar protein FlaG